MMAKKKSKKKKDSVDQSALSSTITSMKGSEDMINVSPSRVRMCVSIISVLLVCAALYT